MDCGRPYRLPDERLIGSVLQPKYAGCIRPTLELNNGIDAQGLNHQPFGRISGPCCFGGMSELCFDFRFYTSLWASPQFSADIAMITRKAPQVHPSIHIYTHTSKHIIMISIILIYYRIYDHIYH